MFLKPFLINNSLLARCCLSEPIRSRRFSTDDESKLMDAKVHVTRHRFQVFLNVNDMEKKHIHIQANDKTLMIKYIESVAYRGNTKTERCIVKTYTLPSGCRSSTISSLLTNKGTLKIYAPRDKISDVPRSVKLRDIVISSELIPYICLPKPIVCRKDDWLKEFINIEAPLESKSEI